VAEPGDKYADSKGADRDGPLPTELNPLTNPVLGQNLGRWAQVYFTNPPEKRDQAVNALLQELELRNSESVAAHNFGIGTETDAGPDSSSHETVCPRCSQRNQTRRRLCEFCGGFLPGEALNGELSEPRTSAIDAIVGEAGSSDADEAFQQIQWLREKALHSAEEPDPASQRQRKFRIAGLTMLLVILASIPWIASHRMAATGQAPARTLETHPATAAHSGSLERDSRAETTLPPAVAGSSVALKPGDEELRQAEHYLNESSVDRDPAQAAQWLWKAVAKQNSAAVLLLADLYARGDGVAKSCDQARLLLNASAARGDLEAKQELVSLSSSGCS